MISVLHDVPRDDILLGVVRADGLDVDRYPDGFDARIRMLVRRRAQPLAPEEDDRREAARDILRNGRYKPTGRGKPASEYLLRVAARDPDSFPRINAPVDVCNYLSLEHVVPISLWDLDRAETDAFVFRLGLPGEQFVFNQAGQMIDVEDLVVGCRVREDVIPPEEPIVNPVKDSLRTKTTSATSRVAACVYAPARALSRQELDSVCAEFADLLVRCGADVDAAFVVLSRGNAADV